MREMSETVLYGVGMLVSCFLRSRLTMETRGGDMHVIGGGMLEVSFVNTPRLSRSVNDTPRFVQFLFAPNNFFVLYVIWCFSFMYQNSLEYSASMVQGSGVCCALSGSGIENAWYFPA